MFSLSKRGKESARLSFDFTKSKTFLNLNFDKRFFHIVRQNFLQRFGMLLKLACIF